MTLAPKAQETQVDSIIGRRDVALVPWVAITVSTFAIALSLWLQGGAGEVHTLEISVALASGVLGAVFIYIQDTPLGLRFRGSLWVYMLVMALVTTGLTTLGVLDDGISNPFYLGNVCVAFYLGLVFPPRISAAGITLILLVTAALDIAVGGTSGFDALIIGALIFTAWLVGVFGSIAHARAAKAASALSSYDRLTAMLNRRGFLRQLDLFLDPSDRVDRPVALLVVDLDGFKRVNDTLGHAAGDELLEWVGANIPRALPADAEVGRLGGDEFALLLPGASREEAIGIARAVRRSLADRAVASIGVATSQTRAVAADDLFRVADAALFTCKRDRSLGVHALVAGTARVMTRPARSHVNRNEALSYARLRLTGRAPAVPEPGVTYGSMISQALFVIAAFGAVVVVQTIAQGGQSIYDQLLRYLGLPWVLWFLFLAWLTHGRGVIRSNSLRFATVFYGASVGLGFGVGVAMLATGGLAAPLFGALLMKAAFDAAILPRRVATTSLAITTALWGVVAALGPADMLWVAPFQLAVLGSAFALGSIGYRAFDDVTQQSMSQAHTDSLTHLCNRLGFEELAEAALVSAKSDGAPFALLALDLDDFKTVNDSLGHAAGDELLRRVASALAEAVPDAMVIGRIGGDEFVVVIPVGVSDDALVRARQLAAALQSSVGASVGHAVFPRDGEDLETLLLTADQRSYEQKRAKIKLADARMTA